MTKTDEKPYGSEMGTLTRWKLYVEMTYCYWKFHTISWRKRAY
ncbi:MAG: hypothetical protein ACTSRD_05130 [Promethearchaeota archaeon]